MQIQALDFDYLSIDRDYLRFRYGLKRPTLRSLKARQRRCCFWRAKDGSETVLFDLYAFAGETYVQLREALQTEYGTVMPYAVIDEGGKVNEWRLLISDDPDLLPEHRDPATGVEILPDRVGMLDLPDRQRATVESVLKMLVGRKRMGTLETFLRVATKLVRIN